MRTLRPEAGRPGRPGGRGRPVLGEAPWARLARDGARQGTAMPGTREAALGSPAPPLGGRGGPGSDPPCRCPAGQGPGNTHPSSRLSGRAGRALHPSGALSEVRGQRSVPVQVSQRQKQTLVPVACPPSCTHPEGPAAEGGRAGERPPPPAGHPSFRSLQLPTTPQCHGRPPRTPSHSRPPESPLREPSRGPRTCGPMSPGSPFRPPLPGGPCGDTWLGNVQG